MRAYRNGDPTSTRRAGRPPDGRRALIKGYMGNAWSERSFSRYWVAFSIIHELGDEATKPAILASSRPGGTINIAELQRQSMRVLFDYVDANPG